MAQRVVGQLAGWEGEEAFGFAERLAATAPAGSADALLFSGASVLDATHPATFLAQTNAMFWPTEVLQPSLGAAHLVRASLEAVAHSARANVEQVEAVAGGGGGGGVAPRLVVAGGMARGALFLRMLASLTDRPVQTPRVLDATLVGAAACAAVAGGVFADLDAACAAMVEVQQAAAPDPAEVPVYAAAHRRWRSLYARIESL
jgi:autoinducer 2 (AI-2) kinase